MRRIPHKEHTGDPIAALATEIRYGIGRIAGRFPSAQLVPLAEIGPDLIAGVLAHISELKPCRTYAILAFIPALHRLPDWGTLVVRGPGSWVLRSMDGRQVICPDRLGALHLLGLAGGYE
jgi:hypothetical protein